MTLPAYGPRACRELRQITIAQLADLTGYKPSTLGGIERAYIRRSKGDKKAVLPTYYTARKIANALCVPMDCFYRFPPGTREKIASAASAALASRKGLQNAVPSKGSATPDTDHPCPPHRRVVRSSTSVPPE